VLADLHLHLYGCIRPADLLRHLATRDRIRWDWYEKHMRAAYGAIPPTREIVERYRRGDPEAEALFAELFLFGDRDAGNFDRFQAKFNLLGAGSALTDADAPPDEIRAEVATFTAAIRAGHARDGITYAETRVLLGPTLAGPRDRAVIDTLLAGYDVPDAATTERLALSLSRKDPWAAWDRVRELALGPHGATVTGVDFCFFEEGYPPKDKAEFFAAVRDFNAEHPDRALAILYHVGESFRDKSLESAVRWVHEAAELGANRLGHAIALGIDPAVFGEHIRTESVAERRDQIAYDLAHADGLRAAGVTVDPAALRSELAAQRRKNGRKGTVTIDYDAARLDEVRRRQDYAMRRIRATGAVVEVCPTSNRRIGGIDDPAHHPVHRFLAADLPVVVASDDPGIFGTTLDDELDWVCAQTGGGAELRRHLVDTAWRSRSELLTGRES
jgi:adenosine deaminase